MSDQPNSKEPRKLDEYISYIQQVREGYNQVAQAYRDQKSDNQLQVLAYQEFKQKLVEMVDDENKPFRVIELGCGSGYPVAEDLIQSGLNYTGIDLSEEQINLAKRQYPDQSHLFVEEDILEYLSGLDDQSVDGIISLFTIFHLPRTRHIDLFTHILRVLKPGGRVLFTSHPSNWEGIEDDWFGARMLWSNFSYKFYQVLLGELGFVEELCYHDVKEFRGKEERTYYMIFSKKKL